MLDYSKLILSVDLSDSYVDNEKKRKIPEGQNSQCGKCLLSPNNRLFKMSGCPLEQTVEGGGGGKRKNLLLSFNVTWAWHSTTRLTCQGISIKGNWWLSVTSIYITQQVSERLRRNSPALFPEANYHLPATAEYFVCKGRRNRGNIKDAASGC